MPTIKVKLGSRSYPVVIETGKLDRLARMVANEVGDRPVFIIWDAQFYALYGKKIHSALKAGGVKFNDLVLSLKERDKNEKQLAGVQSYLLDQKITRSDLVLACGGGIISDLAGYAAASVLRGVKWGIVSSTLLGMVDAAVGGKTGINHSLGKNLIGAFWQPKFVYCDTDFIRTLPDRHLFCGMGEVIKYAGLAGGELLTMVDRPPWEFLQFSDSKWRKLISLCVAYKADIVSRDETEGNLRMYLNLGHTFGHGIENSLNYKGLLHGEAVLVGILGAIELSSMVKKGSDKRLSNYANIVSGWCKLLPQYKLDSNVILQAMTLDKKRRGKKQPFILLDRPGRPFIIDSISRYDIRRAVNKMLTRYRHGG